MTTLRNAITLQLCRTVKNDEHNAQRMVVVAETHREMGGR